MHEIGNYVLIQGNIIGGSWLGEIQGQNIGGLQPLGPHSQHLWKGWLHFVKESAKINANNSHSLPVANQWRYLALQNWGAQCT